MVVENQHNVMPDNSIELSQGRVILNSAPPDPKGNYGGPNPMVWNGVQNQNQNEQGYHYSQQGGNYNQDTSYSKGYDTGYDRGYWQGYDRSYNDGYEEGYRKAREEAERNATNFQNNQFNGYPNGYPNNGYQQNNFQQNNYANSGVYQNNGYQQYPGYQNGNFQQNTYQQPYNQVNFEAVQRNMGVVPADYYSRPIKSKLTYGLLSLFLGCFGVQKFYMGKNVQGVLSCIFCATGIPAIIGIAEGIITLTQKDEEFEDRHHVRKV